MTELKKKYQHLTGKRIHLTKTDNDDGADLIASRMKDKYGTVKFVDDLGRLHVAWEGINTSLTVIPSLDEWELA